jgi:hypothetical protein
MIAASVADVFLLGAMSGYTHPVLSEQEEEEMAAGKKPGSSRSHAPGSGGAVRCWLLPLLCVLLVGFIEVSTKEIEVNGQS